MGQSKILLAKNNRMNNIHSTVPYQSALVMNHFPWQIYQWKLFLLEMSILLSQPQLNHNSTQPNITKVGFDTKMTLRHHHHHPPPPPTTTGNSTSSISQLLLIRFCSNFKGTGCPRELLTFPFVCYNF